MFWGRKISISSIYLKYVVLLGSLYLKGPDSKSSRNRQTNTPLSGFPMVEAVFLFVKLIKIEVGHACYMFADIEKDVYE